MFKLSPIRGWGGLIFLPTFLSFADRVAADRISLEVEGSGTLNSSNETCADGYARSLSKYTLAMR